MRFLVPSFSAGFLKPFSEEAPGSERRASRVVSTLRCANHGTITGYYRDVDGILHAFVYADAAFTTLDFPGASDTTAFGINDKGEVVGTYNEFSRGFVAIPRKSSP